MLTIHTSTLVCWRTRKRARLHVLQMGMTALAAVLSMHSLLCRHYLSLCYLLPVSNSPWCHLVMVASSEDSDMGPGGGSVLQLMGHSVTWAVFNHLLTAFQPLIEDLWTSSLSGRH